MTFVRLELHSFTFCALISQSTYIHSTLEQDLERTPYHIKPICDKETLHNRHGQPIGFHNSISFKFSELILEDF